MADIVGTVEEDIKRRLGEPPPVSPVAAPVSVQPAPPVEDVAADIQQRVESRWIDEAAADSIYKKWRLPGHNLGGLLPPVIAARFGKKREENWKAGAPNLVLPNLVQALAPHGVEALGADQRRDYGVILAQAIRKTGGIEEVVRQSKVPEWMKPRELAKLSRSEYAALKFTNGMMMLMGGAYKLEAELGMKSAEAKAKAMRQYLRSGMAQVEPPPGGWSEAKGAWLFGNTMQMLGLMLPGMAITAAGAPAWAASAPFVGLGMEEIEQRMVEVGLDPDAPGSVALKWTGGLVYATIETLQLKGLLKPVLRLPSGAVVATKTAIGSTALAKIATIAKKTGKVSLAAIRRSAKEAVEEVFQRQAVEVFGALPAGKADWDRAFKESMDDAAAAFFATLLLGAPGLTGDVMTAMIRPSPETQAAMKEAALLAGETRPEYRPPVTGVRGPEITEVGELTTGPEPGTALYGFAPTLEERRDAEAIREDERQVPPARAELEPREREGREDIQRAAEARAEARDREAREVAKPPAAAKPLPPKTRADIERDLAIWRRVQETGDDALLEDMTPGTVLDVSKEVATMSLDLAAGLKTIGERRGFWNRIEEAIEMVDRGEVTKEELGAELAAYQAIWGKVDPLPTTLLERVGMPELIMEPAPAAAPAEAKQPWEMTQEEYSTPIVATGRRARVAEKRAAGVRHRAAVTKALAAGKPVPPEVLAEYPDLAKPEAEAAPAPPAPKEAGAAKPRPSDAERDITQEVYRLAGNEWDVRVRIADLHAAMPTLPLAELHKNLLKMQRDERLVLFRLDDPHDKTKADEAAALHIAGFPREIIYMRAPLQADLAEAAAAPAAVFGEGIRPWNVFTPQGRRRTMARTAEEARAKAEAKGMVVRRVAPAKPLEKAVAAPAPPAAKAVAEKAKPRKKRVSPKAARQQEAKEQAEVNAKLRERAKEPADVTLKPVFEAPRTKTTLDLRTGQARADFHSLGIEDADASKSIIAKNLKALLQTTPEFAIDPTFTVDKEGRLVFRDGYTLRFGPKVFGLEADALKPGQKIRIKLSDWGINAERYIRAANRIAEKGFARRQPARGIPKPGRAITRDTFWESAASAAERVRLEALPETELEAEAAVYELGGPRSEIINGLVVLHARDRMEKRAEEIEVAEPEAKPTRIISEEAAQKAKETIEKYEKGEFRAAGIPGDLMRAYFVRGAYHFENGLRTFAEWSGAMVKEMGRRIKPHLQEIWDTVSQEGLTSVKLESVIAAREKRGLEAVPTTTKETQQEWIDKAQEQIRKDPALPARLIAEQTTAPRALDPIEVAVLQVHRRTVANAYEDATRQFFAAEEAGDDLAKEEARRAVEVYELQMQAMEEASKAAGEKWARSGVARQLELKQDYSLAAMIRRARVANDGKPLTDGQRGRIKRQADRIAELERQLEAAEKGAKENVEREHELERVKVKYQRDLYRLKLKQRSLPRKIIGTVGEVFNVARSLMTSFDLSAVLRQGGFIAVGHPVRAARGFPAMLRALLSERRRFVVEREIHQRPNAELYKSSGLYLSRRGGALSEMEEAYMSRWAEKIPGVAASERAYTTFLDRFRADTFDAMVKTLGRNGEVTKEEARAIANFINVATGRGSLGMRADAQATLSTIFFAPRLVASRFQILAGQPLYGGTWRTRSMVAMEYARFLTGIGLVYGLVSLIPDDWDWTVELDPRSSDFGKIKVGNTRVDPLVGLSQTAVLVSRLIAGKTKTQRGKVVPIRGKDVPYGYGNAADVMARFLRSKLSPMSGTFVSVFTGKNYIGEPVTVGTVVTNLAIPMAMRDIYEAMIDQGVPKGAALGLLAILGVSMQTYGKKRSKPGRQRTLVRAEPEK